MAASMSSVKAKAKAPSSSSAAAGNASNGKRKASTSDGNVIAYNSKQEQREKKRQRRGLKDHADTINECKKIWEELRQRAITKERKTLLSSRLMTLIKGNIPAIIFKHDAVRIVQCAVQHGDVSQRQVIFSELRPHILALVKSKYGKFLLGKLLKYGTHDHRKIIIEAFHGQVKTLIKHREAATLLETAYSDWANSGQRNKLVGELYGPEFLLFKESRSLTEVLKENPEKRTTVVKALVESITPCLDKGTVINSIVHHALRDFFCVATSEEAAEFIEPLRELLVEMLHTKDGAFVTMQCLWRGMAKDRKIIVKSFKPFVKKICMEEFGHVCMLALMDCVDDTVLVQKTLLSEVVNALPELVADKYGRKVFLHLLQAPVSSYFSVETQKFVLEGRNSSVASKKDDTVRRNELLRYITKPLLLAIIDNAASWCRDGPASQVVAEALVKLRGEQSEDAIAAILALSNELADDKVGHRMLKRLIADCDGFAARLISVIDVGAAVTTWGGVFVLDALATKESEFLATIKKHKKVLKKSESPAAKALLDKC